MIHIKKIYDVFLSEDKRIRDGKADFYRTIYDDDACAVDINVYVTDLDRNFCIATVNVSYKREDLEIETKYDSGIPPTSEPSMILDILQNGIDELWGGAPHFIWFNKSFVVQEGIDRI